MQKSLHIQDLYNPIYIEIFSFLTPKDFLNLACTSKFFHALLSDGTTWKAYIAKCGGTAVVSCANIQVSNAQFFQFVKFAMRVFYSKPDSPLNKFNTPLELLPVDASSTDFNQSIDKVLDDEPRFFWSSVGSADEDSDESLVFLFSRYLVIPTSVLVTFFTAADYYEEGTFEFPCKRLQVQFSFDGHSWEYGSDVFEVNGKHEIEVKMKGKVGIARYMKINVIGKTVRQPTDDLYYVAIQRIKCFGYKVDSNEKANTSANELLVNSWIANQIQKTIKDPTQGQVDGKEIVDYYATQTYSSDVYVKFLEVLASQDKEAIWEYLQAHKFLLTLEMTFLDIFRVYKEFGPHYFGTVVQERKRHMLNVHETLLLFLIYLDSNTQENENIFNHNIAEVVGVRYATPAVALILYMSVSANTLVKIREMLGKGVQEAVDFLKNNKKVIYDKPTDYDRASASMILFYYLSISKLLNDQLGWAHSGST